MPGHGGFLFGVLGCSYALSLGTILPVVCTPQGLCAVQGLMLMLNISVPQWEPRASFSPGCGFHSPVTFGEPLHV